MLQTLPTRREGAHPAPQTFLLQAGQRCLGPSFGLENWKAENWVALVWCPGREGIAALRMAWGVGVPTARCGRGWVGCLGCLLPGGTRGPCPIKLTFQVRAQVVGGSPVRARATN